MQVKHTEISDWEAPQTQIQAPNGGIESPNTVKLGLYVHGFVRTLGYYVLSVDRGHRQSDLFALSLLWIKRTLFRTYLFHFP